jgi:hypothetical protein
MNIVLENPASTPILYPLSAGQTTAPILTLLGRVLVPAAYTTSVIVLEPPSSAPVIYAEKAASVISLPAIQLFNIVAYSSSIGVSAGLASESAVLLATGTLVGALVASAQSTAQLTLTGLLAGLVTGAASEFSLLQAVGSLAGSISATTYQTALLSGKATLVASLTCHASGSATVKAAGVLIGSSTARATESGVLKGTVVLIGSSTGRATLAGHLVAMVGLLGNSSGHTTMTGLLSSTGKLLGVGVGAASETALIKALGKLSSFLIATSTVTGVTQDTGRLRGSITGFVFCLSDLKAKGALLGNSTGLATETALLHSPGILIGSAVGRITHTAKLGAKGVLIGASIGISSGSGTTESGATSAYVAGISVLKGVISSVVLVNSGNKSTAVKQSVSLSSVRGLNNISNSLTDEVSSNWVVIGLAGNDSVTIPVSGFNFEIPTNKTVAGIEISFQKFYSRYPDNSRTIFTQSVQLYGPYGSYASRVLNTPWTSQVLKEVIGGPTDNWGGIVTSTFINDSNFGFAIQLINTGAAAVTICLNNLQVQVFLI